MLLFVHIGRTARLQALKQSGQNFAIKNIGKPAKIPQLAGHTEVQRQRGHRFWAVREGAEARERARRERSQRERREKIREREGERERAHARESARVRKIFLCLYCDMRWAR